MHDPDTDLKQALRDYAQRWPEETALAAQFAALLDDAQDPFARERLQGHFTGSAWLVSADGARVLLTHHRKLQRWLQLGGHADGERDPGAVALREAQEESGLSGLTLLSTRIFDLDRHWIPERKDAPGHWHYDLRYVVRAGADETFMVSAESLDLAWCEVADVAAGPDLSMRRMACKWQQAVAAAV
ncbi:NUDIX hydrolase [Stenotrophomonas sp. YIM B06876]|uniref:NUDIX hydrolase n=1 Tax=Stenotrophomonas sp. YIM B06876 TaxID=3060211 RepID=UPI0027398E24|nr:NUDIX hydrolase [Stenotrophomonas sp. YIM B06876]